MKQIEGEAPMFEKLELTRMAQALASHAGARLGAVSQNIAQADTPGYRAVDVADFATAYRDADTGLALRTTRAGHVGSEGSAPEFLPRTIRGAASPDGNTVSVETEMVKAAQVRQEHEMALAIYRSVSDVLRTSLGRSR
jgi:flagellar basal-body rod protein FlgB